MDNFIKKIFNGNIDELVHLQFQKFSRGEFKNKALISAKSQSGGKFSIGTSAEYANELVRIFAEKLGDEKTLVKGMLITTLDLDFDYKEKKQAMGIKKYLIEKEMSGKEILELLDKFPKAFFALSFKIGNSELKIKEKAPKSGKPSSKGDAAPKADFCKIKTTDREIVNNLIFDVPNFKKLDVNHTFIIEKIIMPEGEKDFAKIRELAKRKGKVIRELSIDGKKEIKEAEFEA